MIALLILCILKLLHFAFVLSLEVQFCFQNKSVAAYNFMVTLCTGIATY